MGKKQCSACLWLTGAVSALVAFPAYADAVKVTGVQVKQTDNGIEVILEIASGGSPQVFTTKFNETIEADLAGTQLQLPSQKEFRVNNPAPGIAEVTVSQLYANTVRVRVTGDTGVPQAVVVTKDGRLVVSLTPSAPTATLPAPSYRPTPLATPTPTPLPSESPIPPPLTENQPPTTASGTTPQPSTKPTPGTETTPTAPGTGQKKPETPNSQQELPPIEVIGRPEGSYRVPDASVGTRTNTPIRNVPQSIQVAPRQLIEDQKAFRVIDALRNFGVVQAFQPPRLGDIFTIRGFQTNNILRNGLIDANSPILLGIETANLERIEVLRGPASVLYGQGSPGGTINLVTKQPLREPYYSAELSIGSYDFYRPAIDLSGPVTSDGKLLYRLNASYLTSNDFIDFFEQKQPFVTAAISWQLARNTKLTLEGDYLDANQSFDYGLPAVGTVLPNPNGKIPINRFVGEPSGEVEERRTFRVGYTFEHRFSENWSLQNAFRFRLLHAEQHINFPQALQANNRILTRFRQDFLTPDIRNNYIMDTNVAGKFKTGSIQHQVVAGFNLYRDIAPKFNYTFRRITPIDVFNPEYDQLVVGSVFRRFNQKTKDDALGLYAQDQISLADNLKVVVGGRFDFVEDEVTDYITSKVTSQSDQAFSPRVGIVYQPIKPISLYASFTRSFEQVTGQTTLEGNLFKPRRGTQYEVGIKTDLLDNKLSATLALYQLTLSNVLTPDPRNTTFNVQTGEQRSRGIEFNVEGEILPGWNVVASYAYTNARVTRDNRYPVGNRLINVPENGASLWTTYRIPKGALQGLGFGVGLFYVGDRQGDLDNSFTLPNYLRTDAAIYYRRDRLNLALNFKNLFDIKYFETSRSIVQVYPGAPFTALFTVKWEF